MSKLKLREVLSILLSVVRELFSKRRDSILLLIFLLLFEYRAETAAKAALQPNVLTIFLFLLNMKSCFVIVFFYHYQLCDLAFKRFVPDLITKARAEFIKNRNVSFFQHLSGIRNLLRPLKEFSAKTLHWSGSFHLYPQMSRLTIFFCFEVAMT